jgi:hypothetical protein
LNRGGDREIREIRGLRLRFFGAFKMGVKTEGTYGDQAGNDDSACRDFSLVKPTRSFISLARNFHPGAWNRMSRLDAVTDWVEQASLTRYNANMLSKICLVTLSQLAGYSWFWRKSSSSTRSSTTDEH